MTGKGGSPPLAPAPATPLCGLRRGLRYPPCGRLARLKRPATPGSSEISRAERTKKTRKEGQRMHSQTPSRPLWTLLSFAPFAPPREVFFRFRFASQASSAGTTDRGVSHAAAQRPRRQDPDPSGPPVLSLVPYSFVASPREIFYRTRSVDLAPLLASIDLGISHAERTQKTQKKSQRLHLEFSFRPTPTSWTLVSVAPPREPLFSRLSAPSASLPREQLSGVRIGALTVSFPREQHSGVNDDSL